MRVLFLTNIEVDRYGVAEILRHLGLALRELGVEVLIAGSDASAQVDQLPGGLRCAYVPLPKPGRWLECGALMPLLDLCRRERIDLIHCHGLYRPGTAARLVRRRLGIPYVATSHGDLNPLGSERIQRWSVRRRCAAILREAAGVTHNTPVMQRWAQELCDVSAKDAIIPNGVDLAWWRTPVAPLPGRYLLALGRLIPTKGFDLLLPAVRQLVDRGHDVSLVLAGDGAMLGAWRQQAVHLGLRSIHHEEELANAAAGTVCFPGLIAGERKRRLFAGCEAVLFPSRPDSPEALPMVLLEALAAGKAIVASRLPCVEAVLTDGRHGFLVAPGSDAFASAIDRLLSDAALRDQCELHNRAEAERYDWRTIAGLYHEVYRQALAKTQSRKLEASKTRKILNLVSRFRAVVLS